MRYGLFAIWRKPTWVHLLALPDFLTSVAITIESKQLSGIYNLCDDCPVLLQEFLDELAAHWGYRKPWRLPAFFFRQAVALCEIFATSLHTRTPLTRDMIYMGMTSVVADTRRMKQEIQRDLLYPNLKKGLTIL